MKRRFWLLNQVTKNFGLNIRGERGAAIYSPSPFSLFDRTGRLWSWCVREQISWHFGRCINFKKFEAITDRSGPSSMNSWKIPPKISVSPFWGHLTSQWGPVTGKAHPILLMAAESKLSTAKRMTPCAALIKSNRKLFHKMRLLRHFHWFKSVLFMLCFKKVMKWN